MVLPSGKASRLKERGLLNHSNEELWDFSFEDLASMFGELEAQHQYRVKF